MMQAGPPSAPTAASHSPLGLLFGVSLHEQAVFFRQLATMIDGGLTSARAVETLGKHARGPYGAALLQMAGWLNGGSMLYKTMEKFPEFFSEFVVCLVQAGETGGQLDRRLKDIADFLEQSYEIRQRMVSQIVYPLLILHVAIFVPPIAVWVASGMGAYLQTVIPRLVGLYVILMAVFASGRLLALAPGLRVMVDTLVLYIPLLGKVARNGSLMRALRALGDLLEAGIPTAKAVEVAARAGGNMAIGERLLSVEPSLNRGQPLSTALAEARVVPPMVMQMIAAGEATGTMGTSLLKAAELLKIDFDNGVKRIAAVAPALLMLGVAAIVGYQYISFFRSYFDQINSINH